MLISLETDRLLLFSECKIAFLKVRWRENCDANLFIFIVVKKDKGQKNSNWLFSREEFSSPPLLVLLGQLISGLDHNSRGDFDYFSICT